MDYDNVQQLSPEKRIEDVAFNINRIADLVAMARLECFPECHEVVMRLYGGWIDMRGQLTYRADWLYRVLHTVRGRRHGARITPEVALSLLCHPDQKLIGTYRSGTQKMVDTMLCADIVYASRETACPIGILSDDDDMVPGLVFASTIRRGALCSRKRDSGAGVNDIAVAGLGVVLRRHAYV